MTIKLCRLTKEEYNKLTRHQKHMRVDKIVNMLFKIQSGSLTYKGRNANITKIKNMIIEEDLELMTKLELDMLLAVIPIKEELGD